MIVRLKHSAAIAASAECQRIGKTKAGFSNSWKSGLSAK
jgi:hypothetical protein